VPIRISLSQDSGSLAPSMDRTEFVSPGLTYGWPASLAHGNGQAVLTVLSAIRWPRLAGDLPLHGGTGSAWGPSKHPGRAATRERQRR
jgi:hypothetical protein